MAKFLGGCLNNIIENMKTLQIIFGMQISMGNTKQEVKQAHYIVGQKLGDIRELELPVNNMRKVVKLMEQQTMLAEQGIILIP